ncbi:MAG: formyltransferase family protein [Patescibacteria group bacterium]
MKTKIAVLIGRGSRLPNLYEKLKDSPHIEFRVVISHKKEAPGIDFAKSKGIDAYYFRITDWYKEKSGKAASELTPEKKHELRKSYMLSLANQLKERQVNFIFMTGWDLIMLNELLSQFPAQVVNVHPSLLPSFPGENAWIAALDYGVKIAGATVHFVIDESMDTGPIILQKCVDIEETETADSLRQKLNVVEDELAPKAVELFSQNKLKIEERKVIIK